MLAVLGLLALAWVGVPPLLKSQIEQHASAALGRPVTVGRIDFTPWTLELTAEQLAIGAAPGAASAEPLSESLHAAPATAKNITTLPTRARFRMNSSTESGSSARN